MLKFTVETNGTKTPLVHYWETCVGSCHAYTALREDYREQLTKAHRDAGFKYVRFHGLLNDDMSVVVRNRNGELVYNFFNIDSIFDFLLSIGMKPFIELSYMPEALASTPATLFHYKGNKSKPKDYAEWDALIRKLTEHLVSRYGADEVRSWFFEVWNEPNLLYFFEGTREDYFELYDHTARAIKSVDPCLSVGGPATAINAWIPEMIEFCEKNGTPLDFISTHHYPTDDYLWSNGFVGDNLIEDLESKKIDIDKMRYYERGILTKMMKKARTEAGSYPLYYTEWNSSAMSPDHLHDKAYAAAFVAKTIIDNLGMAQAYSFWTFTDIFEEQGQLPGEFHGGFGLQTVHGIPKPTYRAFEALHQLGNERIPVTEEQETVGMIASTAGNGEICIVAYNHNIPDGEIKGQHVEVVLQDKKASAAEITLIDDEHCNPAAVYEQMGSPDSLSPKQLDMLHEASKVTPAALAVEVNDNSSCVRFYLPPHSVALIRII